MGGQAHLAGARVEAVVAAVHAEGALAAAHLHEEPDGAHFAHRHHRAVHAVVQVVRAQVAHRVRRYQRIRILAQEAGGPVRGAHQAVRGRRVAGVGATAISLQDVPRLALHAEGGVVAGQAVGDCGGAAAADRAQQIEPRNAAAAGAGGQLALGAVGVTVQTSGDGQVEAHGTRQAGRGGARAGVAGETADGAPISGSDHVAQVACDAHVDGDAGLAANDSSGAGQASGARQVESLPAGQTDSLAGARVAGGHADQTIKGGEVAGRLAHGAVSAVLAVAASRLAAAAGGGGGQPGLVEPSAALLTDGGVGALQAVGNELPAGIAGSIWLQEGAGLAVQTSGGVALATEGLDSVALDAGVGSSVQIVAGVAGVAVSGGIAGETVGVAVGADPGRGHVEAQHAGHAVGGGVAGGAGVQAGRAAEGGVDEVVFLAVKAGSRAVAGQTLVVIAEDAGAGGVEIVGDDALGAVGGGVAGLAGRGADDAVARHFVVAHHALEAVTGGVAIQAPVDLRVALHARHPHQEVLVVALQAGGAVVALQAPLHVGPAPAAAPATEMEPRQAAGADPRGVALCTSFQYIAGRAGSRVEIVAGVAGQTNGGVLADGAGEQVEVAGAAVGLVLIGADGAALAEPAEQVHRPVAVASGEVVAVVAEPGTH